MNAFGKNKAPASPALSPAELLQRSRALARAEGAPDGTLPLWQLVANPNQPRKHFDPAELQELADNIRVRGVLQPLMVRPVGDQRFEIVFGERRYRAAQLAGLSDVPVIIRAMTDDERDVIAAVENLQRRDLSKFEEADAKLRLVAVTLNLSAEEAAAHLKACRAREAEHQDDIRTLETLFAQLGREQWKSFVTNKLPVLGLPEPLRSSVRRGELDYSKAVLIARAPAPEHERLLTAATGQDWTQEQVQQAVRDLKPAASVAFPELARLRQRLSAARVGKLPEARQQRVQELLTELDQLLDLP